MNFHIRFSDFPPPFTHTTKSINSNKFVEQPTHKRPQHDAEDPTHTNQPTTTTTTTAEDPTRTNQPTTTTTTTKFVRSTNDDDPTRTNQPTTTTTTTKFIRSTNGRRGPHTHAPINQIPPKLKPQLQLQLVRPA